MDRHAAPVCITWLGYEVEITVDHNHQYTGYTAALGRYRCVA